MDEDEQLVQAKDGFDLMEVLTRQDRYAQSFSRCGVKGRDEGWGRRREEEEKKKKRKKRKGESDRVINDNERRRKGSERQYFSHVGVALKEHRVAPLQNA